MSDVPSAAGSDPELATLREALYEVFEPYLRLSEMGYRQIEMVLEAATARLAAYHGVRALPARSDEGLRTTLEPESTVPAAFVTRIYQTPAEHHHSETVPCRLPMCAVAFRDAIIAAATADYAPAALAAADNTPTDPDEDGNWWINKVAAADNETTHD